MATVGLVACSSLKLRYTAEARDLYVSPLFKKSRQYVQAQCNAWFVLSAKHGLVHPLHRLSPYEESLNEKSRDQRRVWAQEVWKDMRKHLRPGDQVIILAGQIYREHLCPLLIRHGCEVKVPLKGFAIGHQLQWLSAQTGSDSRENDIDRFYDWLQRLETISGAKRLLSQCTGRQAWPEKGVYFFFEPGESRSGRSKPRVVRIGTHGVSRGSKATLWDRLRTHKGTNAGKGNHRGSIFRRHVGLALARRTPSVMVSTWAIGQSASAEIRRKEEVLERMVSDYIGTMSVLWLAVEGPAGCNSDRAYLERNAIGLLAGPPERPSPNWLGLFSPEERIRRSGLWNLNFVGGEYSPEFLDVLGEYVSRSETAKK